MFGSKKQNAGKPAAQQQGNDEFSKLMKDLPGQVAQAVSQSMNQSFKEFARQQQPAQPAPAPQPKPKEPLIPENTNFDDLSNKEMFGLMEQTVGKMLDRFMEEKFNPQIQGLSTKFETQNIRNGFEKLETKHPELREYAPVMASLLKDERYASLPQEDLFELAKAKAPDIGEKIAQRRQEEEAQNKPKETFFGGLTPTSGYTNDDEGDDTEPRDFKDVANGAWEKVMADIPANVIGGDNV